MKYLRLFAILLISCPAAFTAPGIELTGILTTPEKSLFAVTSTRSGCSMWISVGQSFEGYEVLSYVPDEQSLCLKKGEERIQIRLKDAKIKSGSDLIWVKPKPGESSIGLIAQSRVELSVSDKDGNVLYRGLLDPGETRRVPRGGDLILTTDTPEKVRVEVDGKQWPLQIIETKTYLKTAIVRRPKM
jgi:hypothetical protein